MIKSTLTPPTVDQATIDHYIAKGKRARSEAMVAFFKGLFAAPQQKAAPTIKKTATA